MKKKVISCLLFVLSGILLYAQQSPTNLKLKAIDPNTSNEYYLFLSIIPGKITGTYSEQQNPGAVYTINAAAIDNKIKGRMTDNSGILSFRFTCTPVKEGDEDGLSFTLDNPLYASMLPRLIFKLNTEDVAGKEGAGDTGSSNGFDRGLIGKWTSTDYYGSGDFSSTTRETMVINANGTVTIYESQVSANTGDSYINSSPGKVIGTVKIITANNQIFEVEAQTNRRALFGNYTLRGNSLLITGSDGKKKLWKK